MSRKKFRVIVTITLRKNPQEPQPVLRDSWSDAYEADRNAVRAHVFDAVKSWGGQGPPDNPFWPRNIKVVVK